ncbi:hypothetical protein BBI17_005892 [Phytophthora kernoviae]|uniref:EF-hand domain-containing protein n=1 Tax=Phytophthora kernoviae TaxID=325452 RepID=A0A3R7H100_9STRA|nr:hypothetical protein BBI17_005892 [Phytophthora kernoviae]
MWTLLFVLLLLLSVGITVAFVAFGDALLTHLLHRFAPAVVGAKFSVSWSLKKGSLELRDLVVGRHVLPKLEPLSGLPLDLERLEMEQLLVVVPLFDRVARVFRGENLSPDSKRLESKVQVAGLRLGLSLDAAEKWMWERGENTARCQEAIKQAAIARLARVNTWTTTVVQKLKDLENMRQLICSSKKKAVKKDDNTGPLKPAFWHLWVDELLDSFAIVTKSFSLSIRDEFSGSTVGISLDVFEIGRSGPSGDRRKRTVRMVNYEMVLNAKAGGSADTCHLIAPLSMEIGVFMPFIFQSLVMGQGAGERVFELEIAFIKGQDFVVELRPAQVSMLMKLLQPLNFYYDWQTAAAIADDLACVQPTPTESEEYMMLFSQQWKLDKETGFLSKMHKRYTQKEVINARLARLGELETKVLATRLLYLRSIALGWEIPNAGKPLPFVSEEVLEKGNLRKFLENPVDNYVDKDDIPDTPPMLHLFRLSFKMAKMNFRLMDNNDKKLMTFFTQDVDFELRYRMAKVAKKDTAVEIALEVSRFGLLDNRGAPTNVFHQMMDRNPEAEAMMTIALSQRGDGYMDVAVIFKHFSLLLVFDPLLYTTHMFMPAIFEDEKEQMRFIACEMADSMDSPEQRDAVAHLYEEDLPKAYSPLMLGGLSLGCNIVLQGCEFCLIGDSASLKSPVLAFTADTKLRIVSSDRSEAIELELVDVALQPCTIILRDDDIDLDIGDVRSILELEEIEGLLRSATNCENLTKTEFDATVNDFVSIVDSDRSGDISLEEFESALSRNKILYTRLHHGVVAITGHEYVDPDMQRNKVPYLSGDSANTLSNATTLATFWERYEEQIGASITSLNGQPPIVVQKKMVRAFKNYDYAQESWNRIVNPSLVKPVWEGGSSNVSADLQARKRSKNNFGVGKISFDVYGNYYNTKARQTEPFIEFYQGILDLKKEPDSPLEVIYSSDRYFQLNITSAFMEAVNSNVAAFSKVEIRAVIERLHINEEGGIFWMLNESGVNVKYYLVAKKQAKERVDEEVVTSVAAVSPGESHACMLLNTGEAEEYEKQNLKEKQLRQAFREADEDGSGELDTEEVRTVLRRVYEEEDKQRRTSGSRKSSMYKRSSSSILDNEAEFAQAVEDFIALADTDKSGQVSWEEFKIAISKSRATVDRYISVEIEGYRAIHNVPLASIGQTQVYELTPLFEDVESENSIATLYDRGVALLTKVEKPTRHELQKAIYQCWLLFTFLSMDSTDCK